MNNLKKCPFCGSDAKLIKVYKWQISCSGNKCNAEINMGFATKKQAITVWNRRVNENETD